jgi:hypothetical protein
MQNVVQKRPQYTISKTGGPKYEFLNCSTLSNWVWHRLQKSHQINQFITAFLPVLWDAFVARIGSSYQQNARYNQQVPPERGHLPNQTVSHPSERQL